MEKEFLNLLRTRLDAERYRHTLAVADTGELIARRLYAENKLTKPSDEDLFIYRVRQAALLHDYAKNMAPAELRELAEEARDSWQIDNEEMEMPVVLHAPVSAYLARRDLGIEDQEVLEAIRYHTIGSPEMGIIARIIFVADYIEPNRTFSAVEQIRDELYNNGLESAIIKTCDLTIKYHLGKGSLVHSNTLRLRNACLRRQQMWRKR